MNAIDTENAFSALNPTPAPALAQSSNELGQGDFIELLVAQIQNQDPTKPMDPSEFMNQLAQFSTVNGVQELKTAFDTLADKLSSDQSIQAANLVDRSVLLLSNNGLLEAGGTVSGQVNLPQHASAVNVKIISQFGEDIRTIPLGGHEQGSVQFLWDGFAEDGSVVQPGNYRVAAEALIDGTTQAVEVSLETRIDSVTLNQDGSGTVLNLANGESVPLSFVQQIK